MDANLHLETIKLINSLEKDFEPHLAQIRKSNHRVLLEIYGNIKHNALTANTTSSEYETQVDAFIDFTNELRQAFSEQNWNDLDEKDTPLNDEIIPLWRHHYKSNTKEKQEPFLDFDSLRSLVRFYSSHQFLSHLIVDRMLVDACIYSIYKSNKVSIPTASSKFKSIVPFLKLFGVVAGLYLLDGNWQLIFAMFVLLELFGQIYVNPANRNRNDLSLNEASILYQHCQPDYFNPRLILKLLDNYVIKHDLLVMREVYELLESLESKNI